jgi:hypothetical protein
MKCRFSKDGLKLQKACLIRKEFFFNSDSFKDVDQNLMKNVKGTYRLLQREIYKLTWHMMCHFIN